jgi:hypothetical protein
MRELHDRRQGGCRFPELLVERGETESQTARKTTGAVENAPLAAGPAEGEMTAQGFAIPSRMGSQSGRRAAVANVSYAPCLTQKRPIR